MQIGLDPHVLQRILSVSTGGNYTNNVRHVVPGIHLDAPSSNGYKPGFRIALAVKDLGLAMEAAKDVNATSVLGPHVLQAYTDASEDPRYKDLDSRVIYKWLIEK